jgi:hypothetical protein
VAGTFGNEWASCTTIAQLYTRNGSKF